MLSAFYLYHNWIFTDKTMCWIIRTFSFLILNQKFFDELWHNKQGKGLNFRVQFSWSPHTAVCHLNLNLPTCFCTMKYHVVYRCQKGSCCFRTGLSRLLVKPKGTFCVWIRCEGGAWQNINMAQHGKRTCWPF